MIGSQLSVFARYPLPGTVKTRLVPPLDAAGAAALYRAFLLDALDSYSRLGEDVETVAFVADPDDRARFREMLAAELNPAVVRAAGGILSHDQVGRVRIAPQAPGDLGARLAATFAEGFKRGCDQVCAIGTDHPTLPDSYIRNAFDALVDHDVALGPADDGGYYLIATRGYHPELFDGIAWSTAAVAEQTLDRAAALGLTVAVLPVWYDVDDEASLRRLVAERGLLKPESRTARLIEASEFLRTMGDEGGRG